MEKPPGAEGSGGAVNSQIIVALIGATATILAALLAGYLGPSNRSNQTPEPPPTAVLSTGPSVSVEGPTAAPLNHITYFTVVSNNAGRAEWSIGGFNEGKTVEVDPLSPTYQIQVEPSNASRVGDTFTLAVTVYDADGASASTTHTFQVTADQ